MASPVDLKTVNAGSVELKLARAPALYVGLILFCALAAFLYKLRFDGAFACPANGYVSSAYLSDCTASNFGDYDHGAFWFGLEPEASRAVAEADVLFVGNSRLQFAMSVPEARKWFSALSLRYYLLGFSHSENAMYMGPLLSKIGPRAKVYVINVDRFFDDRLSPPTERLLKDRSIEGRYREKRGWQVLHRPICGAVPALCGNRLAVYRERADGYWRRNGQEPVDRREVSDGRPSNVERWSQYAALGEKFIAQLGVDRRCVVLTLVPTVDGKREEATAIARSLGLELVSPQVDGLRTFDGSHLDADSAARWSAAFLQAAGPRIRECLAGAARPTT
jgi:hypothetical protein